MSNFKKTIASVLALTVVIGLTACGGSTKPETTTAAANGDSATTTTAAETETAAATEAVADSGSMEITWMSHYDLNPGEGQERSAELALFEDTYGGKINYKATTWDARFEDLAASILADQSPDIFPYEWIAFPCGVMKNQYNSVDELIDWTDPLWADMKTAADGFVYNDKHYVAPYEIIESLLMIYDRTVIQEEGLDDPYELYQQGKWDWDALKSIMTKYCEGEEGRIGLMNAFGRSMVMSTGETFVTYEDGKFVNNIKNPNIDRVQEFLSSLAREGLTGNGEYINAGEAYRNGNVLFYGSGNWDIQRAMRGTDHEIFIVPTPKDPQSDNLYVAENLQGFMWVAGSKNATGVKTWLECNRIVRTDEEYIAKAKESLIANNGWNEEIYNALMDIRSNKFIPVFDYGYGVNDDMNTITETLYNTCCFDNDANEGWATVRDSYVTVIDGYLAEINK